MQKELLFKEFCGQTYKTSFTPPPQDLCVIPVENSSTRSMSLRLRKMFTEKCYTCTYPKSDHAYKSAAEYQRHLKRHHEPQEPRTCSECDKSFEEIKYLDEHMKLHSEDLPEECPHCGKRFPQHSSLGIHI